MACRPAHLEDLCLSLGSHSDLLLGRLLPAPPNNDEQDYYRADAGDNSNRGYVHRLLPFIV